MVSLNAHSNKENELINPFKNFLEIPGLKISEITSFNHKRELPKVDYKSHRYLKSRYNFSSCSNIGANMSDYIGNTMRTLNLLLIFGVLDESTYSYMQEKVIRDWNPYRNIFSKEKEREIEENIHSSLSQIDEIIKNPQKNISKISEAKYAPVKSRIIMESYFHHSQFEISTKDLDLWVMRVTAFHVEEDTPGCEHNKGCLCKVAREYITNKSHAELEKNLFRLLMLKEEGDKLLLEKGEKLSNPRLGKYFILKGGDKKFFSIKGDVFKKESNIGEVESIDFSLVKDKKTSIYQYVCKITFINTIAKKFADAVLPFTPSEISENSISVNYSSKDIDDCEKNVLMSIQSMIASGLIEGDREKTREIYICGYDSGDYQHLLYNRYALKVHIFIEAIKSGTFATKKPEDKWKQPDLLNF